MAMLISRATGNFTSASTWGVADSATGSQLSNPSATTTTTTSYVYSSAFTGTNAKVCDGVVLFMRRVNTTGTFSVALSDDNGVTATRSVTVDNTDLPASESWIFFKFASTLTLDGGADYRVGVLSSSAGSASVGRDGTAGNWARLISTTDTAAPAAGDTMLILGEWTGAGASSSYAVTMDNTATTDFGTAANSTAPTQTNPRLFSGLQIGQNGTLTWGTAAATDYYLKISGNLIVWDGGIYNMGTTATPCPRGSTMYLQFDNVIDGDFGFALMAGSVGNFQGLSRTSGKDIWFCKLNTDEAASSTSLGVDTDTGWLDNDGVAVASTTRTATQCEAGALNGAAGASTLTVDGFGGAGGGLAFAHSGTSPTQAEVILLTRSVKISGGSSTLASFFICSVGSTTDFDWVEFFWIGVSGNGGISVSSTAISFNMQYSCIRDTEILGLFQTGSTVTANIVFSNNSLWNTSGTATTNGAITTQASSGTGSLIVNNNIAILTNASSSGAGFSFGGFGNYDGNTLAGSKGDGVSIGGMSASFSMNNLTVHSCANGAARIAPTNGVAVTFDGMNIWRNAGLGVVLGYSTNASTIINSIATIRNSSFFGNISFNLSTSVINLTIDNCNFNGDTSFSTSQGIQIATGSTINILNSSFGVASGILTTHTTGDLVITGTNIQAIVSAVNTTFASATEVSNFSSISSTSSIKSSKHDNTSGAFKSWFRTGLIERDTIIFNTAAPSERLTPNNASSKLQSGARLAAVDNATTTTINVYVRKSVSGDGAAYNGSEPRLIVKANPACGINSDTVLDTMTSAAGSWEQLTGTTATVNSDGALEFVVDCDGTTGWINVDDWSVS